jgi:ADP-ribose pyrophosphatase YjhB (NUDIX family)
MDISLFINGFKFNLRVGAVVTHDDRILLCNIRGRDYWFLPGGRIKTNESSLDAIERELSEEIGEGYRVMRPLVCAENFFENDATLFHEICFFYEVKWLRDRITKHREKDNEIFEWVETKYLGNYNLKPEIIKNYIVDKRESTEIVIQRDPKKV